MLSAVSGRREIGNSIDAERIAATVERTMFIEKWGVELLGGRFPIFDAAGFVPNQDGRGIILTILHGRNRQYSCHL
jgi:hypothetical protein